MREWNVVVTVEDTEGFHAARHKLRCFGQIAQTDCHNVLAMRVDDVASFLDALDAMLAADKSLLNFVARILPAHVSFDFESPDEFKSKAREAVARWLPRLAGKSFHVRFHRRGQRRELPSLETEKLLDGFILAGRRQLGTPALVSFSDPDFGIDVETIADRAGLSLWTRDDLNHYPSLRID
jgi:tRNA(Ser,Leu) C12 N-acetylase TAN1